MSDRVIDNDADDAERVAELALRPKSLTEFVGQLRVRDQLDLLLSAAKQRKSTADHILFSGPPGLGKTTLAMIVATEMDSPIRITSGPAIQHAGDLASILSSLVEGEIIWLERSFAGAHKEMADFEDFKKMNDEDKTTYLKIRNFGYYGDDAKKIITKLGLKSNMEWREYSKSAKKPNNIPASPDQKYKNKGWVSWADFLG